jgi:hypothetical protein
MSVAALKTGELCRADIFIALVWRTLLTPRGGKAAADDVPSIQR